MYLLAITIDIENTFVNTTFFSTLCLGSLRKELWQNKTGCFDLISTWVGCFVFYFVFERAQNFLTYTLLHCSTLMKWRLLIKHRPTDYIDAVGCFKWGRRNSWTWNEVYLLTHKNKRYSSVGEWRIRRKASYFRSTSCSTFCCPSGSFGVSSLYLSVTSVQV